MRAIWCSTTVALALAMSLPAAAQHGTTFLAQTAPAPTGAGATPPATPASPPPAAAAPAAKLVGLAAWNQLVGNSISGDDNGKPLVEFYAADGVAKSMSGNEISTGTWALVGETICFKYTDEAKGECYRLEVSGTTATYYDKKGTGTRYEILKGNPKGL